MSRAIQTNRRRAFFRASRSLCFFMVAALANAPITAHSEPVSAGVEIVADAPLQAAIQSFAKASSRTETDESLNRIRAQYGSDYRRLIAQLLLYDATSGNTEN